MVVVVVVPVPECKFTLAQDTQEKLSELGCSAVVSGYHAILSTAKVDLLIDGFGISR